MPVTLALERSNSTCTVAVHSDSVFHQQDFSDQRGRGVMCAIEKILNDCSIMPTQLESIYVGIGPGSYTGLRIACSAATMLAYSLNIECHGVSSFEAMAWRVAQQQPISILLDAYRQQYYHAKYAIEDGQLIVVQQAQIIEQDDWQDGDAAMTPNTTAKDILKFIIDYVSKHPDYGSNHLFKAEPLYLRPPAFRQQKKERA